jgi:hypothetical protein
MRKKKKQVRVYGLGGIILLIVLVVIIAACISMGVITINSDFSLENCAGKKNNVFALRAANGKIYSDVIADLEKDKDFKQEDYPVVEKDYSLKLVQIAESTDGKLCVYVYQPSGTLAASEIRFSTAINDNVKYRDYTLTLSSKSGTLSKYIVNDFEILPDALRYYDVSQLARAWNETVDSKPTDDNTVATVAYAVGQQWRASTVDGTVSYAMIESEVVTVTEKHVGYVSYSNGFFLVPLGRVESHYVAFSTDRQIDKLMEADITYISKPYTLTESQTTGGLRWTYGEETTVRDTVKAKEKVEHTGGIFGYRHVWERIESVETFVEKEDLPNDTKTVLAKMKWVLRFTETEFDGGATSSNWWQRGTKIDDVTLLRLQFETAGKTYNLGVVDNKQSGDLNPDNRPDKPFIFRLWDIIVAICTTIWNGAVAVVKGIVRFFQIAFGVITRYWKWFVIALAAVLALALVIKIIAAAVKK